MSQTGIAGMQAEISALSVAHAVGRVVAVQGGVLRVSGLSGAARLGDRVRVASRSGDTLTGEVLQLDAAAILVLPDAAAEGVALGDRVRLLGAPGIAPSDNWIGRVIDPFGAPLDGRPLLRGPRLRPLRAAPPDPA
ncbi:MAG TPA: flagellum-specific ATP synthase FliI, partial [Roseovarius sp.]|nr:flagellum-specific ATP synthase FliI [Roseovarius sp.]